MLYESKVNLGGKIFFGKITHHLDLEIRKLLVKPGFHMIVTVGDLLRHISNVSPISRLHMETIIV